MPRRDWLPLLVAALGAGLAARCSGGSPDPEPVQDAGAVVDGGVIADAGAIDAGTEPLPGTARCELDLSAFGTEGGAAVSRAAVATADTLLKGEAATGRPGDFLLSNDRVRVVIEQPGRTLGAQPYGGNIIDADLVRAGGASNDRFGELGALFQFGRTVDVDRVSIVNDGARGGPAIIEASGRDAVLDFINLKGALGGGGFLQGLVIPDSDTPMGLRITTYYVLAPGSDAVQVIQAFCNDSDQALSFGAGDLVDSGGDVELLQGRTGFPAPASGPGGLGGSFFPSAGEPFVGWLADDVAYGIFPAQDKNQVLNVAGVTGTLYGANSLLEFTAGPDAPPPEGSILIAAKGQVSIRRDFAVVNEPGALFSYLRKLRGKPAGTITGRVTSANDAPVAGARVYVAAVGVLASLFTTDAEGRYAGLVPVGNVSVSVDDGVGRTIPVAAAIEANKTATKDLKLPAQATLDVTVKDASGDTLPAKVTVICEGTCATPRWDTISRNFRSTGSDRLPTTAIGETFSQSYLDPSGRVTLAVPPGKLRIFVSRGPEWSLDEQAIEIAAGATATISSTLTHVVDTTGWVSGDLHVHAVNSPDSPVANLERLRTFMAEGTDVIVSTDHDFITDFSPFLAAIPRGDAFLASITGVELTTFDYGHYNAFPLTVDPASRNGGAVDWAVAGGPGLAPGTIFERLQGWPGEQVVQLNHARSGYFSATQIDTRTLWTRADPKRFRLEGITSDETTGDSRLFDDRFTALEIQNGNGDTIFPLLNDWMSLLSRGIRRTGTAVSDTHRRHGDSGTPRTWVRLGVDAPKDITPAAFAQALNAGRAFGSNGPFVHMTAKTADGAAVEVGDTLTSGDAPVIVTVEVRVPAWMDATEVKLFVNSTGTETDAQGRAPTTLPEAAATLPITLETRENGALGGSVSYEFTPTKDAWIIAYVTGTKDLFPVVGKGGVLPRAFTNPIFVDLAGDGWTPPIDLAAERAAVGKLPVITPQPLSTPMTEARLRALLEADSCHPDEDR